MKLTVDSVTKRRRADFTVTVKMTLTLIDPADGSAVQQLVGEVVEASFKPRAREDRLLPITAKEAGEIAARLRASPPPVSPIGEAPASSESDSVAIADVPRTGRGHPWRKPAT